MKNISLDSFEFEPCLVGETVDYPTGIARREKVNYFKVRKGTKDYFYKAYDEEVLCNDCEGPALFGEVRHYLRRKESPHKFLGCAYEIENVLYCPSCEDAPKEIGSSIFVAIN